MEQIEIIFKYRGALVEAQIYPEENSKGLLYPISLNGSYSFTIRFNDDEGWNIAREKDGVIPEVEDEFFKLISSLLKWELNHIA